MRDNPKTTNLSRRSVIAVLAAGAAANVPAIAAVAVDQEHRHPDAELLELGRQYLAWNALEKVADEQYYACCAAYEEPEQAEVLRHRMEDHVFGLHLPLIVPPGSRRGLSCDPSKNAFYSQDEVLRIRHAPPPSDPERILVQQARIWEIEEAWDAWVDACDAAEEAAGLNEAANAIDAIVDQQRALAKSIATMPATTLAGLQVRALILADMLDDEEDEDDYTDQLMIPRDRPRSG